MGINKVVITNEDYDIIAVAHKKDNKWVVSYRGNEYVIDSSRLFSIAEIPVDDRKHILQKIATIEKMSLNDFLRQFVKIDIRENSENNEIEARAFAGPIEMKVVFRKIDDSNDTISIIEFPKNITVPQYYMFQRNIDKISQLDTATKEEIKEFLKDYASSYVAEELEETLF